MSDELHVPDGHFEEEPIPAPCPHCSNAWSKVLYENTPNSIERVYFVRCEHCGAQGPEKCASRHNFRECEEALKAAIRAWNHRCQVCALNRHKRQAPLQVKVSAVGNESFYLPDAPHVMANLIWRVHHQDRSTNEIICEAVNTSSTCKPEIVLDPNTMVEPIAGQGPADHGRATNIDEEDTLPGIQPDKDDTSLYHMYAAYADIQLDGYTVCIDASYDNKLLLSLYEWDNNLARCRFETTIPTYKQPEENAP